MDFLTPITTAAQMQACDRFTIEMEPISSVALMERASRAVYNALKQEWQPRSTIMVICGPGNNGGDGLCIARMALVDGFNVKVVLVHGDRTPSEDQQFQLKLLQQYKPGVVYNFNEGDTIPFNGIDYIVDGLFGTGLRSKAEGVFAAIINQVNNSGISVFAIDLPSGLSDTKNFGAGSYIQSVLTIGIECAKPSYFSPNHNINFKLIRAGIKSDQIVPSMYFLSPQEPWISRLEKWLPKNPIFGHKGTMGSVLLIGGAKGMSGAIALAAKSCIENGAGYTRVLTAAESEPWLAVIPKAMCTTEGLHSTAFTSLFNSSIDVIAIGPGLGTGIESKELLIKVLSTGKKIVIDADALNIVAQDSKLLQQIPKDSLLTPHPGEFLRLFGFGADDPDFIHKGCALASDLGIHILAKNKYSSFFSADGEVIVGDLGNPSLAQGGSGDRLTGAIAAWWAKTDNVTTAVIAGQYYMGC